MADIPIPSNPGQWLEQAGLLGVLLAGLCILAWVLRRGIDVFMRRIESSEARCEARNDALAREIVEVRKRHEDTMAAHLVNREQVAVECKVAIERMTNVAERMVEVCEDIRRDGSGRRERSR